MPKSYLIQPLSEIYTFREVENVTFSIRKIYDKTSPRISTNFLELRELIYKI
jgi:hypothetical protein